MNPKVSSKKRPSFDAISEQPPSVLSHQKRKFSSNMQPTHSDHQRKISNSIQQSNVEHMEKVSVTSGHPFRSSTGRNMVHLEPPPQKPLHFDRPGRVSSGRRPSNFDRRFSTDSAHSILDNFAQRTHKISILSAISSFSHQTSSTSIYSTLSAATSAAADDDRVRSCHLMCPKRF